MAKVSLSQMNVESLIELGDQVDQRLREHRVEMQKQLERMHRAIGAVGAERIAYGRRAGSALRGGKSRRNVVVPRVRLGQVAAQNRVGLLPRSKVGRSSTIS